MKPVVSGKRQGKHHSDLFGRSGKKLLWVFAFSILVFSPVSVGRALADSGTMTLKEALDEAFKLRPNLKSEKDLLESRTYDVRGAKSSYLPQMQASYQNNYGNSFLGYFLFPGYQFLDYQLFTIGVNQLIYDFGRTGHQVSFERRTRDQEREKLRKVSLDLIHEVDIAYLNVLDKEQGLRVAIAGEDDAKKHLEEAESRLSAGVGLKIDVTQAKVNLENAIMSKIQAEGDRDVALVTLRKAIGLPKGAQIQVQPYFPGDNGFGHAKEGDLELAYQNRPDLLASHDAVLSSHETLLGAKSQNYPTLTGNGSYFLAQIPTQALGSPAIPNSAFSSFSIGGMLNIPIYQGGLVMDQVHGARARESAAKNQYEETRQEVRSQLRSAAILLREAKSRLSEAKLAKQYAEENDELMERAFNVGTARSVDVVDAETQLRSSLSLYVQAHYDVIMRWVDYKYAEGLLSPDGHEAIP
ncbi:MAG: TolC family protein [Leptospirillum sp.]|jgi:outer membrane protein